MKTLTTISEIREFSVRAKRAGKTVGFVPTMGYLHDGHLSLVREACKRCDVVVVSIFVNPTQFGPGEDFKKYPRDLKRDLKLLSPFKVDVVFAPEPEEMFPKGFSAFVEVPGLSEGLCGASRPGHFRGVATVVFKLFNIVSPDLAFFGQKDFQQLAVIKKMAQDLNLPVKVIGMPTVREADGLAMSSRNKYLSRQERDAASVLFRALKLAEKMAGEGIIDGKKILKAMKQMISCVSLKVKIDYIEICDPATLKGKGTAMGETLIALAAFIGKTRLIDNIVMQGKAK